MNIHELDQQKSLIGTDVSIEECIFSGYTIIDTENKPFDRKEEYRILEFLPAYCLEEIGIEEEEIEHLDMFEYLNIDVLYSFNDLEELYMEDKDSIDSFAETYKHVDFIEPTFYDFLNLASDISAYKGLY